MAPTDVRVLPMPTENSEQGRLVVGPYYALNRYIPERQQPAINEVELMLEIDGQAKALEAVITQPILGTPHFIEAADGDSGEAQFARDKLFTPHFRGGMTTPIETVIQQMTGAFSRRKAYFEKVWERDESGKLAYHKIAFRPALTCEIRFDQNGSFDGFKQETMDENGKPKKIELGPADSFVYVHDSATAPLIGRSMFSAAYRNFIDKLKITQLYFFHCQNIALGNVVGRYEGGSPDGTRRLRDKAAQLKGGGVAILDVGESLDRLESGRSADDFRSALDYLNSQMAISLLAQFLNLGTHGDRGSWALSRDQSDFFLISLESKLKEMAMALTEYVLSPLIYYNFGPDAAFPSFAFEPLSETRKRNALEVWQALVTSAAIRNIRPSVLDAIETVALPMVGVDPDALPDEPRPSEVGLDGEGVASPVAGGAPENVRGATEVLGRLLGEGSTSQGTPGDTLPGRSGVGYPRSGEQGRTNR